jgi:dienelactone hydrolase
VNDSFVAPSRSRWECDRNHHALASVATLKARDSSVAPSRSRWKRDRSHHALASVATLIVGLLLAGDHLFGDETSPALPVLARPNLVAWCIVPFDANKRSPAERAEMVKRLGLRRVAYDWRDEHVASFEEEIEQYKKHDIEFFAFWSWHDALEPLIRKHGIKPQIWVTLRSPSTGSQSEKVAEAAGSLLPLVEKTRRLGLKLGLYNHGGWGGQPNNLLAVCRFLREQHSGDHVGIVYNFHHAHSDLAEFPTALEQMLPYLLCINLNGMADPASVEGNVNKILPIGQGRHESEMIRQILSQGYSGPIGILDHRSNLDAEESLRENLDGLDGLIREIEVTTAFPGGRPDDSRSGELQNLNGYFPFQRVENVAQWNQRQREIRRRILVSQGLWPMPTKAPLNAVVHGRVEKEDYVVDRVYFESIPGHFVTGSLYRPKGKTGPLPAILSPHGHWKDGRFYDAGEALISSEIENDAEQFERGGRFPIQARAVQLARMGCLVFVYDMTGNADSIQIAHRPAKWSHLDTRADWGFMSVQADLRLQNMMGLQTWNSIRAIDFLLELEDTDPNRIGVTGASGGGTQSMIIGAVDDRISAAMPCVMVSTSMQGGCTCENAPLMRIGQGNIDIAAAIAPRPLGLTAADDWTIELETKGYPDLVRLYEMLGVPDRLEAVFHTQFKHNYNQVNRAAMYSFFNRHFRLGWDEPIVERDYQPLTRQEATVWADDHPAPTGDRVGDSHETRILSLVTKDSTRRIGRLVPQSAAGLDRYRDVVGGGWETILGRRLDQVGEVTFTPSRRSELDGITIELGRIDQADSQEQLPVIRIETEGDKVGTVVWLSDTGKASLLEQGRLIAPVRALVDAGYSVLAADLLRQGEFVAPGQALLEQPMWYQRGGQDGWHRFSGYTFGYNHCLFAERVHDVLSLLQYARSAGDAKLHLIGIGRVAGPLAIAARSQSGSVVDDTIVDLKGFRFEEIGLHNDPMFVPGSVKYLDVDGLLSLCAPARLTVIDQTESAVAKQVYAAAEAADRLRYLETDEAEIANSIVELLAEKK